MQSLLKYMVGYFIIEVYLMMYIVIEIRLELYLR